VRFRFARLALVSVERSRVMILVQGLGFGVWGQSYGVGFRVQG